MSTPITRRARSMAELAELQARAFNPEQLRASIISCRPRPDDVIISPYAKCGTTWLQQMFHTLRTRGDLAFDDVSRVVPWIETARMLDIDLDAPQKAQPRGFKSHLAHDVVPKGARYIVSFRDPGDAVLSHLRFMEGWWLEPGAVTVTEYVAGRIALRGSNRDYWHHLISWWAQRENPNVLLLSYEHMSADPVTNIRRVARFCGIPLDDALLTLALERTSLAFMLAHKELFDDRMMREMTERRLGLPPDGDSAKVRVGRVGGHEREMPPEAVAMLHAAWNETVTPKLGFRNYAELGEAEDMRGILEKQRKAIVVTEEKTRDIQPSLFEEERRQLEANRRHWRTRLEALEHELMAEVGRLRREGRVATRVTREQMIDWAYGNTKIENDGITREIAAQAVELDFARCDGEAGRAR